jgi:hypothetical protein
MNVRNSLLAVCRMLQTITEYVDVVLNSDARWTRTYIPRFQRNVLPSTMKMEIACLSETLRPLSSYECAGRYRAKQQTYLPP